MWKWHLGTGISGGLGLNPRGFFPTLNNSIIPGSWNQIFPLDQHRGFGVSSIPGFPTSSHPYGPSIGIFHRISQMDPKQPQLPAPSWGQNKSWSEGKAGKVGKETTFSWTQGRTQPKSIPREYLQGNQGDFCHLSWRNQNFFPCRPGVHPKGRSIHFSKVSQLFRGLRRVKKIRNEGKSHLKNGRNPFWVSWMRDSFSTSTLEFHVGNSSLPKDFPGWNLDTHFLQQGEGKTSHEK